MTIHALVTKTLIQKLKTRIICKIKYTDTTIYKIKMVFLRIPADGKLQRRTIIGFSALICDQQIPEMYPPAIVSVCHNLHIVGKWVGFGDGVL